MIKKILLTFLVLGITNATFSQGQKTILYGKIVDSLDVVKNANIINLKTNKGTFSLDDGTFAIQVSLGDSLHISSIQHRTKKIIISKSILVNKSATFYLKSNTYILDEFELKRNNLIGILGIDSKRVPKNRKDSLLKDAMNFSNVDFSQKDSRIDANNRATPPIAVTVANQYSGLNIGNLVKILNPFKKQKRIKFKEEDLNPNNTLPIQLLSELGDEFFFEKLKIPKENYLLFLEYCHLSELEELYKNNKILDLIEILQKESISYLKIIKK
ncbi:hypothetical protein [Polaribacter sp.]|uniref:hypothetical protein n=1 Tax=Polaribacter sp. TaxID=1920175 RepID=UPI003EF9E3B2